MSNRKTEKERAAERQEAIRTHANSSIAIMEMSFVRNGSGHYVILNSESAEDAAAVREDLTDA